MLQEWIEGAWLASFRRVFALNGIGQGTIPALIYETQSRPVLAHLSELALYDLGEFDDAPGDEHGARSSLWHGTEMPPLPLAAE